MNWRLLVVGAAGCWLVQPGSPAWGEELSAIERGKKALLERHYAPATIPLKAYENAWRVWGNGTRQQPANYADSFAQRYGLHPAPYPNHGYPMGLRLADGLLGKALAVDCLLCHGGSIAGQSYVGLGNASIDYQALYEELAQANGSPRKTPFVFTQVRGTTEAGAMAVYLLSYREPDLSIRIRPHDFGLRDDLIEDAPAWWLLKKKRTMYHTGGADARSVRSIMQFMLTPLYTRSSFEEEEKHFAAIQAYILSLQPPRYPFPIDSDRAARGEKIFLQSCSKCHGTYGDSPTYPNKLVAIDQIGTDRTRFEGFTGRLGQHYDRSWFAQEKEGWLANDYPGRRALGYQAPPLDGVWATAPYFHNGSVPTLHHVLNSKDRPRIFTRSYRTDPQAYDPVKAGWKVEVLREGADPRLPAIERRKVYDTTQPGRGNGGHTYGDMLSGEERLAVIEYLKTL